MKHILYVLILALFLASFPTSYAIGKNIWEQKRERYEKAKREAQQRGEVFSPNEFEKQEEKRAKDNRVTPILIICVIGGLLLVTFILCSINSGIEKIKSSSEYQECAIFAVIIIVVFLLLMLLPRGKNTNSSTGQDYWENSRMHTDGRGY